jgi:hypothetical protein
MNRLDITDSANLMDRIDSPVHTTDRIGGLTRHLDTSLPLLGMGGGG